ncbi:hypothetical protein [Heyndrickxia vini]|uniref:Uncharacterized protein n=1 Tax=Heyndrickxia vini TaxID=1476025 RepID=A0ABX7E2B7_9BACI|nr:hypothetical protein [Heyndrickxia vini]QQZ08497.1 hypothetical protein I5776_15715 [Heyndrickxia vini]
MDELLKNLKENMDNTVLKNLDFRNKNKSEVRKAIYNSKKTKRMKNLFPRILSVGITCIFLIGISYITLENFGLLPKEKKISGQAYREKLKSNNDPTNNSIYTYSQQAENYNDMTKEDVLNKLFNTVDYFESASGKFEEYDRFKDNSTSQVDVEYKISLKKLIGGYEKTINIPDEKVTGAKITTNEMFYNNQSIWNIDNDRKTYFTNDYEMKGKRDAVNPDDVFSLPIRKLYDSEDKFRERPPIGTSGLSLFPYEMAAKYLRFNNLWNIEKQNDELLSHNTIVLHGNIDKSIVNHMQPEEKSFRFWVDKDTGILLKYEIYNEKGEIISYLHPESLSVNVPIDSKQFIPNLSNYNPMQIQDNSTKDSREKDIKVIEHADSIDIDVKAVLDILRRKVPFLYEFSNPELQIFSASMERYKEFNQAYLTYSYKKERNESGSGSRLIYVRMYHKDSVVGSLGDFNTTKGKKLDSFTLNGIKWSVFEIKNTPNAHFIGNSGDYKYEVVTQEVSISDAKRLLKSFKKSTSKH